MIAIIKYNAGNTRSVVNALNRLGTEALVTDDVDLITRAEKVIFPGVGEAGTAMKYLRERNLDALIKNLTQPFLGICLGMQLLCSHTEEGNTPCLGIFNERIKKFPPLYKIPHMGWNNITSLNGPLFNKIETNPHMYFVHSFFAETGTHTIATTLYSLEFSAALNKNNFFGVQFHPEKSAEAGEVVLKNFISL